MTIISYETDVAAWENQQAWLIRNKKFELLDIEHLVGRRLLAVKVPSLIYF